MPYYKNRAEMKRSIAPWGLHIYEPKSVELDNYFDDLCAKSDNMLQFETALNLAWDNVKNALYALTPPKVYRLKVVCDYRVLTVYKGFYKTTFTIQLNFTITIIGTETGKDYEYTLSTNVYPSMNSDKE